MSQQEVPRTETQLRAAAQKAKEQGDLLQALQLYQKLRELAQTQGNTALEADALMNMGNEAYGLGNLALGLDYSRQAQAKAHLAHKTEIEISALLRQARTYHSLKQQERAGAALQEGVRLIPSLSGKFQQASAFDDAGFHAVSIGEIDQAHTCLNQSNRLWREINNLKGLAGSLSLHSFLYRKTNQIAKALEVSLETLLVLRKIGQLQGELVEYHNIALLYEGLGEPEKAVGYLQEGLRRGGIQSDLFIGHLLMELSLIYNSLGNHALALDYIQQALRAYEEISDRGKQISLLGIQAAILTAMGQPKQALATLQRALQLSQAMKSPKLEADTMWQLGALYQNLQQPEVAREWYERSLKMRRETGDSEREIYSLLALAGVSLQKPAVARGYLSQAIGLCRNLADRLGETRSLAQLGDLERGMGQSKEAEHFYQQAITLTESLRSDAGSGMSAQETFFDQLQNPYIGYLTLLVEQGRAEEAFALVQKTKARGLLDLMAGGKIDLSRQLTEDERKEERQRRDRCDALSTAMIREAALNQPGSKKRFEAIKLELAKKERELALFQDTLYAKYAGLGQRRGATTANLAQVAKALPPHAALLEFVPLADGRLALFVVTRSSQGKAQVTATRLARSSQALEPRIAALRAACTNPKKPWKEEAKRLYQALLAPIEARLRGKSQLIVCPDRFLWDVPFAVLTDKTGTPLLERFTLSYANSATTWHAAQATPRKPSASAKLLVVANPQFDAEKRFENGPVVPGQRPITVPDRPITVPDRPITVPDRPITVPDRPLTVPDRPITVPDRDLYVPRGTKLVDLPGTQREADALAKRFPQATIYTRSKAQESVVKQNASKFQRIHLASHAFVNDAAPLLSSVVLANPTPGSGDDGFLTAREIFDLDLSGVELVVLSACNTARGAKQGGEGVIGLTWALFAAGCPTQVLSQWAVDDSSTATLMTRFYDGLAKGASKGSALRGAALTLRRDAKHSHPYFWAPFVLIGDPR